MPEAEEEEKAVVTCTICLSPMTDEEKLALTITRLSCGHEFHAGCIMAWTFRRQSACPICRQLYITKADPPPPRSLDVPLNFHMQVVSTPSLIFRVSAFIQTCFWSLCSLVSMTALYLFLDNLVPLITDPVNANLTVDEIIQNARIIPDGLLSANFTIGSLPLINLDCVHGTDTIATCLSSLLGWMIVLLRLIGLFVIRLLHGLDDLLVLQTLIVLKLLGLVEELALLFVVSNRQIMVTIESYLMKPVGALY